MGFKSKATKANKAKKQEREPIQRKHAGHVHKIRTDLRPSNERDHRGDICETLFPGNQRDPRATLDELKAAELQYVKERIDASWGKAKRKPRRKTASPSSED